MESIKEIRTHIDSVQQTLKITNAMYLISSSKLRKARRQLNDVQPDHGQRGHGALYSSQGGMRSDGKLY